jgi:hypothetical protein
MKKSGFLVILTLVIGLVLSQSAGHAKSLFAKKNKTKMTTTILKTVFSTPESVSAAGITFTWSTDGKVLLGTLQAPNGGWIAVGFGGNTMSSVGKVVIGSVTSDVTTAEIQVITGRKHATASGTIIKVKGMEGRDLTTITFEATLADLGLTGKIGAALPITLARSSRSKDWKAYHGGTRGSVRITL